MSGGLGKFGVPQSTDEHNEAKSSKPCHRLTFVSHAGEDKPFVRSLLSAIEAANVATFFDDDMAVGTAAGDEMTTRAENADQGVVVLSRAFLTKKWPMLELNLFVKNDIRIHPLYYRVNPDELQLILDTYDRQAGHDEPAFRRKTKENPGKWQKLMEEVGEIPRDEGSTSLPDPICWRKDVGELAQLTGLRRESFGDDEAGYVNAAAKMVSPPMLPATVPPLPEHFVNVHLVDEVISELLDCAPNTEIRGVVLTGIGGAGKSVIASAVVRDKRIRRHFADGVLWLDQEPGKYNEELFLLKLKDLAQQLKKVVLSRRHRQGRDSQNHPGVFTSVSGAQGLFRMWQNKFDLHCLLVVDNIWNVEVLHAVRAMGFQILVTTRKEAAIPASPKWCSKFVPPMDEDHSLRVLQNCSGATSAVPRESALEVARTCVFLPFTLAIANSTLRAMGNPLSPDAWRTLHGKLKEGEWDSLNSILAVSIDELGQTRRDLFLMLAVLGKGVLAPAEMLRHLWGEEDLEGARFFVNGLVSKSLLQRRVADKFFVHDLLLDFAKVNINAEFKKFEAIKEAATSRQTQYLGRLDVLQDYFVDRDSLAGLHSLIGLWRSLVELSGNEHLEVRAYRASLEKLIAYKASLEELGEEESTDVSVICSMLGDLYHHQGKYEKAGSLHERSLATLEKTREPDHPDVAASLVNCGILLSAQGRYAEVDPLYVRAVEIFEKVHGLHHPQVASALSSRALLLTRQGRYTEAEPLHERCQAIEEKVLGSAHPRLAITLNNRALLSRAQGKYSEAGSLYKRAQAIQEEIFGPEHPDVAQSLNNRAGVLYDQGKYDEAGPLFLKAIAIGERVLGRDHPEVAMWLNNWAVQLERQGKPEEADSVLLRAIGIGEKTLGPHHPDLASRLNNRAAFLSRQGKHDEAEPLQARAIAIGEEVLGRDHPSLAKGINNRALMLQKQGRYDEAEPLFERAIGIWEGSRGGEHEMAIGLNNLAKLLEAQSKYEQAEPLYKRAIVIWEAALGSEHPEVASGLNNLAQLLESQGKYDEADPLYGRSLALREKALGPNHPMVSQSLTNRARLLDREGKFAEAELRYERAIGIWDAAQGSGHLEALLDGLQKWSGLLYKQGKFSEAEPLVKRVQEILEKTLGWDHPNVATVLHNRALVLDKQVNHATHGLLLLPGERSGVFAQVLVTCGSRTGSSFSTLHLETSTGEVHRGTAAIGESALNPYREAFRKPSRHGQRPEKPGKSSNQGVKTRSK